MSYTTASTLIQTRYDPLPTQGSPSFAALALLSTSTATKIVLWLRFGHRAALVATTEKNQKRSDSQSSFSLGPALPVACTQMMRGTRPMGSPVTIRCRQAPGQHHSSGGWNRNIGNTALPRTDGTGWAETHFWVPRQEHGQDPGESESQECPGALTCGC